MSIVKRPNRLASETSPYLLQHAHNPVAWYPWGDEAFAKARSEGKPLFLSIGYSSCHWCHVMERESFEDEATAALLNGGFVAVKVDREERPDVDDVYMSAVQAMGTRGGWPLSAFLLPDARPFFGGTYFPPADSGGRLGFPTVLSRILASWRDQRPQLEAGAARFAEALAAEGSVAERLGRRTLGPELFENLTAALHGAFDSRHAGFGGAPKFPPHMSLDWLLRRAERSRLRAEVDEAGEMAEATLEAMALGGIHDHLGGGFHRYSTDERWLLPHFEKMLTDNALLLGLYARAFARSGRTLFRRTARGVADYLLAEMRGPEGAFYAGTDADTEGEEGASFVWTADEVRRLLGRDADFFAEAYGIRPEGNFREEATGQATGGNVLHLRREPSPDDEARLSPLRAALKKARDGRPAPGLDDKRVAGWNALAISGLATAGQCLGEPRYLDAARKAAWFLLETCRGRDGRLLRSWKNGRGKIASFLEDEAFLAHALLDLAEATEGTEGTEAKRWRSEARRAVDGIRARFRVAGGAGFAFSGEGNEELLFRPRDLFDKAIPSSSASAVRALVRIAAAEGDLALAAEARRALEEVSGVMERVPHGTETWHLALDDLLDLEGRPSSVLPPPSRPAEGFDEGGCEGGVCEPQRPRLPEAAKPPKLPPETR